MNLYHRLFWRRRCQRLLNAHPDPEGAWKSPRNKLFPLHQMEDAEAVPTDNCGRPAIDIYVRAVTLYFDSAFAGYGWINLAARALSDLQYPTHVEHDIACIRWHFPTFTQRDAILLRLHTILEKDNVGEPVKMDHVL